MGLDLEWLRAVVSGERAGAIVTDKKTYQVGDVAHLLLVTGLKECWAVVTFEGDSVQSRQLMHLTSSSAAFDVPITQKAQPNLVVNVVHCARRPVDDRAQEPQGSAGGAHADHHRDPRQAHLPTRRKGHF